MTGGFKSTQLLFSKTAFVALELSQKAIEISEVNFEKESDDLIFNLSSMYFQILITSKQRNVLLGNIERLDRLLKINESLHDAGFIRQVDFERVKVNRENLITESNNLNILISHQMEMLKYLMGMDIKGNINLTDSLQMKLLDSDILPNLSISQRSELVLLEKQKDLALVSKKMSVSNYYPTLSLYGQYYFQGQREKFDFLKSGDNKWFSVGVVGLNLSLPIFNGFETSSKIDQAEIDYKQASNNYEFTRSYFGIEYENAIKRYINSKAAEQRQKNNVQLAEKVYDIMLIQYQQGVASLSDLLESENSLSESHLSLLNSILQIRMAELDILKTCGNLKSIINR
jgi:outer membrane protein